MIVAHLRPNYHDHSGSFLSIKLKLKAKDREIYDLRQKSTNYEMIIADLKNQMTRVKDAEHYNTEL